MSDYFKDAWDLNNLGINREKSIFLTPKASQSGGSGENNVASPKKQTTKTDKNPVKSQASSKKPTSKSDESAKAMKYWNMKAEMNRTEQEKDSLKTEFDKEMEILHRPDVNDILKKEKSMKDPYFKDLRSMDKEQATKKLISDYENLEIKRGKSSANSKEVLSKRGSKLIKNNQRHISMALSDTAFLNDLNVDTDLYYKGIGSQKSNHTEKIITSNHAVTRFVKTLPEELQSEAMNNYFKLQESDLDDAISYIKNLSGQHSYDNDAFIKNILSVPYQSNSSGNTFNDWKAQQRFKGLSGSDKDNVYYANKIAKGEKYNNLQNEEDFDALSEKGREISWGATLNDLKMDKIKDKQVPAHHMTEKEIKTYAYLWGKYGETQARNYLDFLTDDLKLRKSDYDTKKSQDFAEEHPVLATVSTAPAAFIGDLQSAGNIAGRFLDEKIHPGLYKPTEVVLADNSVNRRTDTILGTVADGIENEFGKNLYTWATDLYHETVPNVVYAKTLPFMIALNTLGDTAEDSLERGTDKGTALLNGAINGGISYVTDRAFDTFMPTPATSNKMKKHTLKRTKNTASDYISGALGNIADTVIAGENSLYHNKLSDYYENTDMNSYEVQRYAKLYAYFNKPLSDALNLKPTATERKNAWEMSNEEFDNYINGILDIN